MLRKILFDFDPKAPMYVILQIERYKDVLDKEDMQLLVQEARKVLRQMIYPHEYKPDPSKLKSQ